MNHQKVYDAIIAKARLENRAKLKRNQEGYVYYENHHIIPKCLNGGNEKENLVLLTAREHFVCHKLLTYIYPKNEKIICAFFRLTFDSSRNRKSSSRDYKYAKEILSEQRSGKPSWSKGKKFSNEHCKNISISRILNKIAVGKNNGMFGKHHSEQSNQKNREKHIGKKDSKKTLIKKSNATKGENNPMYGKSFYVVWVEKYGVEEANKKYNKWKDNEHQSYIKREIKVCPYCGVSGKGAGIIRYHFNNCKHKNKKEEN